MFLLAFFFYIDGVYTIIDMATAYGTALGFDTAGLLLALLVLQVVAFPCSIFFGRLAVRYRAEQLILVCILAYFGIALFAMILSTQAQFWVLAVLVGIFQGGVQALSRSYFTKIIPAEQSGEYFGLMDICGKGASFLGTDSGRRGFPGHGRHPFGRGSDRGAVCRGSGAFLPGGACAAGKSKIGAPWY